MLKKKFCFLIFIMIFILIFLFTPIQQALVFKFENSGKVLAYIPMSEGDTFQLKYTHSIHLSDVIDLYIVKDSQIKQYEMVYEDFSIGMPENAFDGEKFVRKNGKFYIKNMNRFFPHFDLRIGKVRANHTFIFQENEYLLASFIKPGTWVRIQMEDINLWQKWKGVNIFE